MSKGWSGLIDTKRSLSKVGHENPDNEDIREIKHSETQCFSGFWGVKHQKNLHQYTNFTPIDAGNSADAEKSHNLYIEWAIPSGIAHF